MRLFGISVAFLSTSNQLFSFRRMSTSCNALILGCYHGKENNLILTPSAKNFDSKMSGKLAQMLQASNFNARKEKLRSFFQLSPEFSWVVVAGLGEHGEGYCPIQEIDLRLEGVRCSLSRAISFCNECEVSDIKLDDFEAPNCVGEVAAMSTYQVAQWKSKYKPKNTKFSLFSEDQGLVKNYEEGYMCGEAQAFAASLSETPANLKVPSKIAEYIISCMPTDVKCIIRDKQWITDKNMNLFLSVNQGSVEPPVLLEAHYKGSNDNPIILVGKGITFDTGGISLKPSASMCEMKADMQGAAVVFATIKAIANLKLPVHVIAIAPFTENLPSGSATKPGDVFTAMNGITVEVDNTDAEGRLVLGDALTYAETFNPKQVVDLATLTGAVIVALGSVASAIYTKSPSMLQNFKKAAVVTGDRVWHMPMYKEYEKMMKSEVADLTNSCKKREAGSCTAAAFLSKFVTINEWVHLDIAGVMCNGKKLCYTPAGMSGRPTRTLIEYVKMNTKQ